jgi:AAA domain
MALRAKKPEIKEARVKALIYADKGAGKTHFCCSIPDTYYIDSEGLEDYPHLVNMLKENGGDLVYLTELSEMIKEVRELLSTKHNYKTLVIDSISFPFGWISQLEAERLQMKTPTSEGTEFGANLAKAKRLIFQLGILLSSLDMNVIVVAHEKTKYMDNKEIGKTFDINDKMAYSLGAVWHLRLQGKSRKLFIEKSRYAEMETGALIDFNEGYEVIKSIFGEQIFKRESKAKQLATTDQLKECKRLIQDLHISDEIIQKMIITAKSQSLEDIESEKMQDFINKMKKKFLQGEEAA